MVSEGMIATPFDPTPDATPEKSIPGAGVTLSVIDSFR